MRIDAHCDTAVKLLELPTLRQIPQGHLDYCRLRGRVDVQFFAIFIDAREFSQEVLPRAMTVLERFLVDMQNNSDLIEPLLWREQLSAQGPVKALIAAEGGELLQGRPEILRLLFRLGLRSLGLTWNYANALGAGAAAEDGDLTPFGCEVIAEMNKLGMVADGAHLAEKSFWSLLRESSKPPIVSHTACAGLWPHRRNLNDGQLKALGERGGVAGIAFARSFLAERAAFDDIVRHIDYGVKKAGIEHIGIGADLDGTDLPLDTSGVEDWPKLAAALSRLGYGDDAVDKIMGGNFLRVLRDNLPSRSDNVF
ncbi:MAG: membrane dipeptidase [Clostridiales bacterium]|nr:membrane dipeptidase [Clostridiales bacterium]